MIARDQDRAIDRVAERSRIGQARQELDAIERAREQRAALARIYSRRIWIQAQAQEPPPRDRGDRLFDRFAVGFAIALALYILPRVAYAWWIGRL